MINIHTAIAHQYSYDLNYFDLIAGWGGMVQTVEGTQDDPNDILQVGVGLAPTEDFDTYDELRKIWGEFEKTKIEFPKL